jgi:hypothetical protein
VSFCVFVRLLDLLGQQHFDLRIGVIGYTVDLQEIQARFAIVGKFSWTNASELALLRYWLPRP